jgi:hypothetical protein
MKERIVLLANHLSFGASTIDAIYKDRWQIEVFFKTIKQNLKIKNLCGYLCQCRDDSDMDSTDSHPSSQVHDVSFTVRMVPLEPYRHALV